jgi:hypothetical protein
MILTLRTPDKELGHGHHTVVLNSASVCSAATILHLKIPIPKLKTNSKTSKTNYFAPQITSHPYKTCPINTAQSYQKLQELSTPKILPYAEYLEL